MTAWRLYEDLGIESLEELEAAAHDGRLERFPGMGAKRIAGIRDSLAQRLGHIRQAPLELLPREEAPMTELLDVEQQYREEAAAGTLKKIAPRRFNPSGEAWLPVFHTTRGPRQYTALFSNSARAHELQKTKDSVVLYYDGGIRRAPEHHHHRRIRPAPREAHRAWTREGMPGTLSSVWRALNRTAPCSPKSLIDLLRTTMV